MCAKRTKRLRIIRNELFQIDCRCHYCQVDTVLPIEGDPSNRRNIMATVDHIITRAHGGSDSKDNLVLACQDCNNRRGIMPYDEFKAVRSDPVKWAEFKKNNSNIHRQLQGALTDEIRKQATAIRNMRRAELMALDKERSAQIKADRRLQGEIRHRHNILLARECGHNGIKLLAAWINRANFSPRKDGKGTVLVLDIHPWEHYRGDVPTEDCPSVDMAA